MTLSTAPETTRSLHEQAMQAADVMFAAKRVGDLAKTVEHAQVALTLELRALDLALQHDVSAETRRVLRRSATFLAINAQRYRTGEDLVLAALRECDDDEVRDHWFSLLEQVRASRHLEVKGQQLAESEIQISLAGRAVQPGMAPHQLVFERVNGIRALAIRLSKRVAGLQFADDSKLSRVIQNQFVPLVSVARAASYAISVRFTQVTEHQLELNLGATPEQALLAATNPRTILLDIMTAARRFKRGGIAELSTYMDTSYARAIGGLLEQLSPDAKRLDVVGLTLRDGDLNDQVELPTRNPVSPEALLTRRAARTPNVPSTLERTGTLLQADARSKVPKVRIVDPDESQDVVVFYEPDRWSDVVPNYWSKRVVVVAERVGARWMLRAIDTAE